MSKKNTTLQRYLSSAIAIIAVAAILLIIGIIFKNTNLRLDCTEGKLYTLSNATKTTLKRLDKKLTIRFYYSKDVAQMPVMLKNYAKRVDDMLTEYEICSNGHIRIEKLNPKPDTDAEDSANLDGVTGQGSDALGYCHPIWRPAGRPALPEPRARGAAGIRHHPRHRHRHPSRQTQTGHSELHASLWRD